MMSRRFMLKTALGSLTYAAIPHAVAAQIGGSTAMQVPYSAGRQPPKIKVPPNACDCHHHIYDPVSFPYAPDDVRNQPPATVDVYRLLQRKLALTRSVVVTPSAYRTNNACTLSALKQMDHQARGVVVVDPTITRADIDAMHEHGVRGIRFNIATGDTTDPKAILSLSQRVNERGWHVQFWMSAKDTVQIASLLNELPSQIVFDHRGHLPQPAGIDDPAFKVIANLMEKGKAWVKLSGLYIDTTIGEPSYADTVKVGRAFVQLAPERIVWGTDWPHPSIFSERKPWPDDANMLDLLAEQAPSEATRERILVTNPVVLYGFPP
jgi:predicted TIM-barrel fold metal-dependent hydrolase